MSENLVVFDLEMNQGYKPYPFDYEGTQQTFRGEVVQIGAARIDRQFRVLETFSITMKPRIFKKLHHHVAKVTGLTQEELNHGAPMKQGMEAFLDWCGEDCTLLEWGLDDVPVLKQNLLLLGLPQAESFPGMWYDVQQMCASQFPPQEGEKMNLEAVVERLALPQERPFHDALSDVLYTCEVGQRLDAEQAFDHYPSEESQLKEALERRGPLLDFSYFQNRVELLAWRNEPEIYSGLCPDCGAPLELDDMALKLGSNLWYTLGRCPDCGREVFLQFKLSRRDGLHWSIGRGSRAVDEEGLAKWQKDRRAAEARKKKAEEAGE